MGLVVQPVVDRGDAADHAPAAAGQEELALGVAEERVAARGRGAPARPAAAGASSRGGARCSRTGDATKLRGPERPLPGATLPSPMARGPLYTRRRERGRPASLEIAGLSARVLRHPATMRDPYRHRESRPAREGSKTSRRRAISNKVFVGNLSFDVTREELIEAFSAAGRVVDAKVPDGPRDGTPARLRLRRVRERRGRAALHRAAERAGPQGSAAARERGREPAAAATRRTGRPRRGRVLPPPGGGFSRPGGPPGGGFSRPGGGAGGGFSRPGGGGGFARPGGGFRAGAPTFPAPEEAGGDSRGRRFRQKPDQKPVRKTSPRRRRDDVVDDDDSEY